MYNFNIAYGDIFDYVGKADCICVTIIKNKFFTFLY